MALLWTLVWKSYLSVSLGASAWIFLLYGWDKFRAKTGGYRVSESTLHWWAVLGGWPGALLAQGCFRHKTRKSSYRSNFRMAMALHVMSFVVCWLVLA